MVEAMRAGRLAQARAMLEFLDRTAKAAGMPIDGAELPDALEAQAQASYGLVKRETVEEEATLGIT